ncbi:MAG: tyrosine phosphatase family protein, partial [Geminicoccaceae bacterium]
MSAIYVCNLIEMPGHAEALGISHLVSLVAPNEQPPTPTRIPGDRHHRVEIHDINEPLDGHILPAAEHVEGLIDFLRAWPDDEAPILIHCVAGISRSMAAALITLVIKAPGRELEAARQLRDAARHAYPNRRMIAVADE